MAYETNSVVTNCTVSQKNVYLFIYILNLYYLTFQLYHNVATYWGGGMYIDGTAAIENCNISGNAVLMYGSGMYISGNASIINSIFSFLMKILTKTKI
jgi:hypothetical protein